MSTTIEQRPAKKTDNNANETRHYVVLTIAIVLGLVGAFLRFVQDSFVLSQVSNLILLIASIIAIRVVFRILK